MNRDSYTASKTRSNRPGWSIGFRHPLRKDASGRTGLKMRRGLGTSDEAEADAMVAEMNVILGDPSGGTLRNARKPSCDFRTGRRGLLRQHPGRAGRPGSSQGITHPAAERTRRWLFACVPRRNDRGRKTSLLRQLIGSDPDRDRFPSTAPAKTTIADIEVIQADGPFEAAVTFFTEFQTQANIEECVVDAALAVLEDAAPEKNRGTSPEPP